MSSPSNRGRILGVDLGSKRVGLALSDETALIAQPYGTLAADAPDFWEHLARILEEEGVKRVVVGLPRNMNGTVSGGEEKTQGFVRMLQEKFTLPVNTWDERLSTVAAERLLITGDVRRARRRQVVDRMAAAIILQGFLDWWRHREGNV